MKKNKITNFLITILWILLLLFWEIIPYILLKFLNIDYDKLSITNKSICLFISDLLFLSIIIKFYYKDIKKDFKNYFKKNFKDNLNTSIKYWLMGLGIMFLSNLLIAFAIGDITNNEESVRELINQAPLFMFFNLAIYAPLTEELIFRKSIRNFINNKYIYAITSGVIFGSLHVISSINGIIDLLYLIPYCSLGIAFGFLYAKSNNIFSSITVHSIHNTLALVIYLLAL